MSDIIAREGFTKFPNFIFSVGLNHTQITVLLILYQHCPNINPSRIRISKISGLSISTVKRCFSELEEMNLIKRKFVTGMRSHYFLHNDYNSFIGKKLSTKPNKGGSPMNPGVGSNTVWGRFTHEPRVGSPMNPKQDKEQDNKQENKISNFIDTSKESIEDRKKFIADIMCKK